MYNIIIGIVFYLCPNKIIQRMYLKIILKIILSSYDESQL